MSSLTNYYDLNDKPENGFDVLPAGTYTVKITDGEMKRNKKNTGQYLQVEMTIVEGEHRERKIFDRFNLDNPSREAVRIARGQFAALREAVGVLEPKNIAEMKNIRFQVAIKCVRRTDKPDEMANEVQRYIKRGETPETPRQQGGDAPWSRSTGPNPDASSSGQSDAPGEVPF